LRICTASLIHLVGRSCSLSMTVVFFQSIVWLTWFAWSLSADLLYSVRLAVRWLLVKARGHSNLTKRPHRRRTRTVQSYSPSGANVHPHLVRASWSVQAFLHSIRQKVLILYSPSKLPFLVWICSPYLISNTWFFGLTGVHDPNGISIDSAVFTRFTIVTDKPTDRQHYSLCNNRPHLHT